MPGDGGIGQLTPTAETEVPPTPVTTESLSETISGWNDTRLLEDSWLMFPVWTVATVSATPTGPAPAPLLITVSILPPPASLSGKFVVRLNAPELLLPGMFLASSCRSCDSFSSLVSSASVISWCWKYWTNSSS